MKKVLFFLTLISLLFLAKKPLLAVFTQLDFQQQVKGTDMNLSKWIGGDAGVLENITAGLTRQIIGDIPEGTAYVPGGAIGGITNLIVAMYANPPASSVEYFADLGKNLGIVKPAYAQAGTGFEGLRPILPLWKAFRNIAYLFFTIVFIVIGFAIMFRVKLNPQTVISIQNAIPRVVIALILVTFSYAIAGLLIDLMYIISSIIVTVIEPSILPLWIKNIIDALNNILPSDKKITPPTMSGSPSFLEFLLLFFWKGTEYTSILSRILNPATLIEEMANAPNLLTQITQTLTSFNIGVGSSLLSLILSAILLFVFFKVLLSLLKAYVSIIISVIFGPLQIMLGALPGQNAFGGWIRNLIANLAVFPAVIIMMALTMKIVELSEGGQLWVPPPLKPTLFGGYPTRIITAMIVYGMLLLMPKVADMVKEALQVKPFPYGAAIGEAMKPARWAWGVAWPAGRQAAYEQWLAGYPSRTFRGIVGRAGELIGLWKKP